MIRLVRLPRSAGSSVGARRSTRAGSTACLAINATMEQCLDTTSLWLGPDQMGWRLPLTSPGRGIEYSWSNRLRPSVGAPEPSS